jgi:hypothetical protein
MNIIFVTNKILGQNKMPVLTHIVVFTSISENSGEDKIPNKELNPGC